MLDVQLFAVYDFDVNRLDHDLRYRTMDINRLLDFCLDLISDLYVSSHLFAYYSYSSAIYLRTLTYCNGLFRDHSCSFLCSVPLVDTK